MDTWLHNAHRNPRKDNAQITRRGVIRCLIGVLLIFAGTTVSSTAQASETALLAVASSFRELWPELGRHYTADTGRAAPRASFGSSGLLASQIAHGAPFELFLSADQASVDRLQTAGQAQDSGVTLALGRLTLLSRLPLDMPDSPAGESLAQLRLRALSDRWQQTESTAPALRLAIPNPQHAPYGMAAREALQTSGLWPLPPERLLKAENAAQTLQFALTGAVDFAIIPESLAHRVPADLHVYALPEDHYRAVAHTMVLLPRSGEAARHFHDWLLSPTADRVLARHGLVPSH